MQMQCLMNTYALLFLILVSAGTSDLHFSDNYTNTVEFETAWKYLGNEILYNNERNSIECMSDGMINSVELLKGDAWAVGKCHIFRMIVKCNALDDVVVVFKPETGWGCREDYRAEVAAFVISRILGLYSSPIVVERKVPFSILHPSISQAVLSLEIESSKNSMQKKFLERRLKGLTSVLDDYNDEMMVNGCFIQWLGPVETTLDDIMPIESTWKSELLSPKGKHISQLTKFELGKAIWLSNMILFDSFIDNRDRWSGSNVRGVTVGNCFKPVYIDHGDGFRVRPFFTIDLHMKHDEEYRMYVRKVIDVHYGSYCGGRHTKGTVCRFSFKTTQRLISLLNGTARFNNSVSNDPICTFDTHIPTPTASKSGNRLEFSISTVSVRFSDWLKWGLTIENQHETLHWFGFEERDSEATIRSELLDLRVNLFLKTLSDCIAQYGHSEVFLP